MPQVSPQLLGLFWEMVINPFVFHLQSSLGAERFPSAQIPPVTHTRPSLSCQVLHCQRPPPSPAAIFPPGLRPAAGMRAPPAGRGRASLCPLRGSARRRVRGLRALRRRGRPGGAPPPFVPPGARHCCVVKEGRRGRGVSDPRGRGGEEGSQI